LLAQPDLLVLDEPTMGLDNVLRRNLWAMFHRLVATGVAAGVERVSTAALTVAEQRAEQQATGPPSSPPRCHL
jgi:ABC-type multidrug transport system ATPase subunit